MDRAEYNKDDDRVFKGLVRDFDDSNESENVKALSKVRSISISVNWSDIQENGADLPEAVFFGGELFEPKVEVNVEEGPTLSENEEWIVRSIVSRSMFNFYSTLLRSQRVCGLWSKEDWKQDYIPSDEEVA